MTDEIDSAELDAIKELRQSGGWALVSERIRLELERKRDELEHIWEIEKTQFDRGYIRALRTVLTVPEILEQELGGKKL